MSTAPTETCATCYGQGEVVTDQGPLTCRDCMGHGKLAGRIELFEWRLREIERAFGSGTQEEPQAVRWLAFELRRAREALTEILALSEDLPDVQERARLRFVANDALKLYDVAPAPGTGAGTGTGAGKPTK